MIGGHVEYATALFSLGLELKKEEDFVKSLTIVESAVSVEYLDFLSSPSIKLSDRLSALDTAFGGKIDEEVSCFLKLLVEKRKIKLFFEIKKQYEALLSAHKNVCHAKIKSAVKLNEDQELRLKDKLEKITGKTVVMEIEVDEKLIGGITVLVDDTLIDGSVYKKLRSLKEIL